MQQSANSHRLAGKLSRFLSRHLRFRVKRYRWRYRPAAQWIRRGQRRLPIGSGAEAAAETPEAIEAVKSGADPEAVETTEELYDYLPKARPILREQMDETRAPSFFRPCCGPLRRN